MGVLAEGGFNLTPVAHASVGMSNFLSEVCDGMCVCRRVDLHAHTWGCTAVLLFLLTGRGGGVSVFCEQKLSYCGTFKKLQLMHMRVHAYPWAYERIPTLALCL